MKTVYKYSLAGLDNKNIVELELPIEAELLHVEMQERDLRLWAMIDTEVELTETRKLMVAGTGHEIDETLILEHINSFMAWNGALVLHAFEVKR